MFQAFKGRFASTLALVNNDSKYMQQRTLADVIIGMKFYFLFFIDM